MAANSPNVRLNLELSPSANNILEEVAANQSISTSDVLARALGLMKIVDDARKVHRKIAVVDSDGTNATDIQGL